MDITKLPERASRPAYHARPPRRAKRATSQARPPSLEPATAFFPERTSPRGPSGVPAVGPAHLQPKARPIGPAFAGDRPAARLVTKAPAVGPCRPGKARSRQGARP